MRALKTQDQVRRDGNGAGLTGFLGELLRTFRRTRLGRLKMRRERRLRLRETLSLGERRLVAILACDQREFLVAATGQTVSLLAPLEPPNSQGKPGMAAIGCVVRAGR